MNAAAGLGACGGIHLVQGGTVAVGCRSRLQQARSWHDFGSSGKTSPLASIRLGGRLQNPYPLQQRSRRIETRTATKTDTKVFVQTALQPSPSKIIISTQRMETGTRGSEVPLSFC